MADPNYLPVPPLPSERLREPTQRRGDLLDYYFGPTGIPQRVAAANEIFNPVTAILNSMRQAGRAADPALSRKDRVSAGIGSLTDIASVLVPVAGAASRGSGRAIVESLTGFDVSPETTQALRFYDEAFPPEDIQEILAREANNAETPEDFWVGRDIVDEEGYALVPNEQPFEYSDEPPEPWATDPWSDFEGAPFDEGPFLAEPPDEINFDDFADAGLGGFPDQVGPIGAYRPLREDAYGFGNPANPYLSEGQFADDKVFPMEFGDSPGVAGMYSRAEKAAQSLKQPTYSDLTQVRRELEARGAPPRELDTQMEYLESMFPAGEKISREDIQGALGNFNGLIVNRTAAFSKDYAPSGGYNGTSTYFTHELVMSGPDDAYKHFAGAHPPPLAHTRAAQYDITTPDGTPAQTHHVIEIQSDWAQHRQNLPKSDEEVQRIAWNMVREGRIEEAQNIMDRAEFDQKYPAPYVKNENDWLDLGVRQNLIDAVNSGSDWITFGNGAQANRYIGMPLEAARRFYGQQVPKSVERVLKKFSREAGIEMPKLQKTPFVDGDEVLGFKLTPEFREAMRKTNLPSFKDGGLVTSNTPWRKQMAETELERRRRILREGDFSDRLKILGYHLGDNLIGFDDEYDTLGERFRTGAAESISNFMDDPVGVSYGALENFAGDVDRAMSGDADPLDYLLLASGAIGGPVGSATGRVAGKVTTDAADTILDPVYRRQLRAATGDPESYEWLGDAAFRDVYVPSDIEESIMWGNPDPAQQVYLDRRKLASELLDQGASDKDIFEQTGILHMPIRSVEGDEELGVRAVGFFDPAEGLVEQLRPNRYANITEKFEDLGGNVTGRASYDTREIVYDKSLVPTADDFLETRSHELAHFDLFDSDLHRSEIGSNIPYEALLRDSRIAEYEYAIEKASNDPDYRAFLEKNLRDIKGLTPEENYFNNPGERIARLREGNYGTARQMSPLEHLNPYMGYNYELGLLERIGNAVRRSRGGPGKYVVVPMTKVPARVSDPDYTFIPK